MLPTSLPHNFPFVIFSSLALPPPLTDRPFELTSLDGQPHHHWCCLIILLSSQRAFPSLLHHDCRNPSLALSNSFSPNGPSPGSPAVHIPISGLSLFSCDHLFPCSPGLEVFTSSNLVINTTFPVSPPPHFPTPRRYRSFRFLLRPHSPTPPPIGLPPFSHC